MNYKVAIISGSLLCGLLVVQSAGAQSKPAAERYVNKMEGVSFRPPAGGTRMGKVKAGHMAHWAKLSPETGEAIWTLTLYKKQSKLSLEKLAEDHRKVLSLLPRMTVTKAKVGIAGGRRAMFLEGKVAAAVQKTEDGRDVRVGRNTKPMAFRQVWIEVKPNQYVTVKLDILDGPDVAVIWARLLQSINIFDTEEYAKQLVEQMKRAKTLLNKQTSVAVRKVMPTEAQWYLLYQKSNLQQPVGWYVIKAGTGRRDGISGMRIRTWSVMKMPVKKKIAGTERTVLETLITRQIFFLSADRQVEFWRRHFQKGASAKTAEVFVEDGLRQRNAILVTTMDDKQSTPGSQRLRIPLRVEPCYLPRAFGVLLPWLIDLKSRQALTFADYASDANDFAMRTIKVIGPELVTVQARSHKAVRVSDQARIDLPATTLWIEAASGKLLKSVAPGPEGLITELTTKEGVFRYFKDAGSIVRAMNAAEAKATKHVGTDDLKSRRSRNNRK